MELLRDDQVTRCGELRDVGRVAPHVGGGPAARGGGQGLGGGAFAHHRGALGAATSGDDDAAVALLAGEGEGRGVWERAHPYERTAHVVHREVARGARARRAAREVQCAVLRAEHVGVAARGGQ